MKLRLGESAHLECNSGQPFFTGTLLLSLLIALALHIAFAALVQIRDLLPGSDRIHPFTDVQAELPLQSLESVTLEMAHKPADFLPPHPESRPKPYLPEVQKPTFFPGVSRLLTRADPAGSLEVEREPLITLALSPRAEELLELLPEAKLDLPGQSRSLALLIDPRQGKLIPLRSKDAPFVAALEKELRITPKNAPPLEEVITFQRYD